MAFLASSDVTVSYVFFTLYRANQRRQYRKTARRDMAWQRGGWTRKAMSHLVADAISVPDKEQFPHEF
tara:strand:- start:8564 stop:8767 length:204 start_codon:yes stop_codon:yes gene_type:complete